MTISSEPADVIDRLVGVRAGDPIDVLRAERPAAKANAQASYEALFAPAQPGDISPAERFAVAAWVAYLSQAPAVADFYRGHLTAVAPAIAAAVDAAVAGAVTSGPYGTYPAGPLSAEDVQGPHWQPDADLRAAVGDRLARALAHAHLLTYRPRDASPGALQDLVDAGWSTTGIVTLSQLIAFVHFQLRVVAGLTVLAGARR
ncbi:CMD domain protein [Hamadaea tsunoensis]|uniref:CMD domain protein n=1 Tax=Hamadaea tsunoensis TaxID=53368 RepID=UPI0003FD12F3|nr:CMD domain protein [Hamadaea tsunoensis]